MKNIHFLTLYESEKMARIHFSSNYTQYSILNAPSTYKESDIISLFSIQKSQIERMFKVDSKWVIISEDERFNKEFENILRSTKVNGVRYRDIILIYSYLIYIYLIYIN